MVTSLEILDTAVKVGLGAALAGAASLLIARTSQKHEIKKLLLSERRDLLKLAAVALEEAASVVNLANQDIYALHDSKSEEKKARVLESARKLSTATNLARQACAYCYIGNQDSTGALCDKYAELIEDLHSHYADKRTSYDPKFANENFEQRIKLRIEILQGMKFSLAEIYA